MMYPPSRDALAAARIDAQAQHDPPGGRSREPAERFKSASAIITVQTSRRIEFPNLVRQPSEGPVEFAERVKQELIRLQGGL